MQYMQEGYMAMAILCLYVICPMSDIVMKAHLICAFIYQHIKHIML